MITPSDHTSLAGSSRLLQKRSGAMKTSVPHGAFSTTPLATGQYWDRPKSDILAMNPRLSLRLFIRRTLAGLRSAHTRTHTHAHLYTEPSMHCMVFTHTLTTHMEDGACVCVGGWVGVFLTSMAHVGLV